MNDRLKKSSRSWIVREKAMNEKRIGIIMNGPPFDA